MKPEIKEQWVAALRSDEYSQGHGALCRGGKYCCLGVLMKITDQPFDKGLENEFMPSGQVLAELGLLQEDAEMLAGLNDGEMPTYPKCHSFAEIADIIERDIK